MTEDENDEKRGMAWVVIIIVMTIVIMMLFGEYLPTFPISWVRF